MATDEEEDVSKDTAGALEAVRRWARRNAISPSSFQVFPGGGGGDSTRIGRERTVLSLKAIPLFAEKDRAGSRAAESGPKEGGAPVAANGFSSAER
jgi:hypothetical protein